MSLKSSPIWLILISAVSLTSCVAGTRSSLPDNSQGPEIITLNIFAAASLTDAFTELGRDFMQEHPEVSLVFNFAGSNQLATQIAGGAPADVFASANQRQMDKAVDSGRIDPGSVQPFVTNRLTAIYHIGNDLVFSRLQDLAGTGILIVLTTEEVPVGQYSREFLDKAGRDPLYGPAFKEGVLTNVVSYEENVRSVLNKVKLGEADAGIVYTSDLAGTSPANVGQLDIPDPLNVIANYPIAPIKDSPHRDWANSFIDFVLGPSGQDTLGHYGFGPSQ
jgi:molybdate transport system substrate-binding protein